MKTKLNYKFINYNITFRKKVETLNLDVYTWQSIQYSC